MADGAVENQELVKATGRGALLNIRVDDSVPLEVACRALREHLGRSRQLYARGDVALDIGRRLLAEEQQERISKVVESESGLTVKQFRCEPEVLERERDRIVNLLARQSAMAPSNRSNGYDAEAGVAADAMMGSLNHGNGHNAGAETTAAGVMMGPSNRGDGHNAEAGPADAKAIAAVDDTIDQAEPGRAQPDGAAESLADNIGQPAGGTRPDGVEESPADNIGQPSDGTQPDGAAESPADNIGQPSGGTRPDGVEESDAPSQYPVGGIAPGGERYGAPAVMVRGTCRAGEILTFPGNVVVMGNVNPGAQIIARGDVLVFGALRGMAHAGCDGDATAVILAMSTASPHLRIADYRWHDDGPRAISGRRGNDSGGPTIARVEQRAIHVSPYRKNHVIDHGGNPNER